MILTPLLFVLLVPSHGPTHPAAPAGKTLSFDTNWKFRKGEFTGAEMPGYSDASWRRVDLPHDWSIEDLPPKAAGPTEFDAISGEWRFHRGDDLAWGSPDFEDDSWQKVLLPSTWEQHSQYTANEVFGWYRRRLTIPKPPVGKSVVLQLGRIDDVDEAWLNGVRIGGSGAFPPQFRTAWDVDRKYTVPAGLVKGDGTDLLAVRVYDGQNSGGIFAAGTPSVRVGPFDPGISENADRTGYTVGGIGWYRRHFRLNAPGKRVSVRFDGIYMNSEVWINGHSLGAHPHGYTTFEHDLTPYLRPNGQENVLAVCVRNEGKNSRWYSGSGIYRHVWMTVRNDVHIPTDGVVISTENLISTQASLNVSVEIRNEKSVATQADVQIQLFDAGKSVAKVVVGKVSVPAKKTVSLSRTVIVSNPKVWSVEKPSLYSARVGLQRQGLSLDTRDLKFGIRTVQVDSTHGFRLNGKPIKLKGGCVHHDNGPLGSVAIDRAEERKVELLKANGFNAVRTSHNPPSPAFLDACDRLGLLVIDEAFDMWREAKAGNEQDYHLFFDDWSDRDLISMVRRDRNHPSVVIWSIGNEIPEQFRDLETGPHLRSVVMENDTTRPITQAICSDWGEVMRDWDRRSDSAFKPLDIGGYNYLPEKYESDHARHPDRVIVGTESYPLDLLRYWSLVERHPYIIGDFTWTAMDYFGEAGIGHTALSNEPNPFFMSWPWYNAWCGDLDVCGFKKPQSYYRDVVWRRSPLEMAVHVPIPQGLTESVTGWGWPKEEQSWNWKGDEGTPLQVSVYSRCERVRLYLNGKLLGEKPVSEFTKLTAKFEVPYAAGELRAEGITAGKVVATKKLETTGAPSALRLTADRSRIRASRNDLSYVTVEVVDAAGRVVPDAEIPVHLTVSGAGHLAAQGSGTPNQPASFRSPVRTTFRGKCLAILQPRGTAGTITLRASAPGVAATQLKVVTK